MPPPPQPWSPNPRPSDIELALGATRELVALPVRQFHAVAGAVRSPRATMRQAAEVASGVRSLARYLRPARPLSIEGAIGPHRRYAAARCSLADAKAVRTALGGTVNDVVLAVISGAFRDVLAARGDDVDDTTLRTLVPVSTRAPGDATANNQVSLIVAELPIGLSDPRERLAAVRAEMAEVKAAHQIEAAEAATAIASLSPPALQAVAVRGLTAALRRMPQRFVNTVTTNVAGPQSPLYALGRGMLEYLPFVPLSWGVRIGVAVMSYNGHLTFGITGDYDTAADVHFMAERIEAQMTTLREHADLATPTRRRHRAKTGRSR